MNYADGPHWPAFRWRKTPLREGTMETMSWTQSVVSLATSLGFGLVMVVMSVVVLIGIDRYLYREIDFVEEIKKGNLSASIFYCVQLLVVAVIVATAIS